MALKNKVQLITYPDSLGGDLKALGGILRDHLKGVVAGVHILPPFPSSGDRGFAPKTYLKIEPGFGDWDDIRSIGENFDVVVDMMVNHISMESEYFRDFMEKGSESPYADYFITMDKLWADKQPRDEDLGRIFLRRDRPFSEYTVAGKQELVWTTFGSTDPSQQVDLDVHSPAVRRMFEAIFRKFSENNITVVRLDAVGYVIKKLGTSCFFVEPDIYEFMDWIKEAAAQHGIELLPEVHAETDLQQKLVDRGFWIYDFVLPYRMLEMLHCRTSGAMRDYLLHRPAKQFTTLDCHDGVPIKPDLDGMYDTEMAAQVVNRCVENGCNLSRILSEQHKDADGFDVHQICGTYFSMLGCDEKAYIAARAVQLFVPGIPQVYYTGLLAGVNHPERLIQTGDGREINRHNYLPAEVEARFAAPVVQRLCELMRFRNNCACFDGSFSCMDSDDSALHLQWRQGEESCSLQLDLNSLEMEILHIKGNVATRI